MAAVVGYHLGAPWLGAACSGAGVFFTLSGYLITTILISKWDRTGDLDLKHFWLRRARRLLPALTMMLIVVLVATPVLDNDMLPERGTEALAALFYVSNWTTIASDVSYVQRFSGPGPLDHLWSACCRGAVLPVVALWSCSCSSRHSATGATAWCGRRLALAAVSFVLMLLFAAPGSTTRMRTKEPDARRRFADRARPGHGLADSAGQQDHREPAAASWISWAESRWRSSSPCSSDQRVLHGHSRGGSCCCHLRPPSSWEPWCTQHRWSDPSWECFRCAGSASAPTASICGTCQSWRSCLVTPHTPGRGLGYSPDGRPRLVSQKYH